MTRSAMVCGYLRIFAVPSRPNWLLLAAAPYSLCRNEWVNCCLPCALVASTAATCGVVVHHQPLPLGEQVRKAGTVVLQAL